MTPFEALTLKRGDVIRIKGAQQRKDQSDQAFARHNEFRVTVVLCDAESGKIQVCTDKGRVFAPKEIVGYTPPVADAAPIDFGALLTVGMAFGAGAPPDSGDLTLAKELARV